MRNWIPRHRPSAPDEPRSRAPLKLHYQPVIDLDTGRPVALEALVRWQHPTEGLLPPSRFIPLAELSGLIIPMGRWVLQTACDAAASLDGPAADLHIAVNVSVRQLTHGDLVGDVRRALASSRLAPSRLMLEVTESAIMRDEETAALALEELSRLGVSLAVDDFGTGYSSLLYLRRYPISALKLDRAFVTGICDNAEDAAICGSVISLARAVQATSIAEGVETIEQYSALRAYKCMQAQGFLWSPGVPFEQLPDALLAAAAIPVPPRRGSPPVTHRLEPVVATRITGMHREGA